MRAHWSVIGFSPTNFVLDANIADADDLDAASYDVPLKDNDKFTPTHKKPTMETTNHIYSGVIIRNLPVDILETDIQAFLVSKGLPADHNSFKVNTSARNKNVVIEEIDSEACSKLISSIHEQIFFNKKIYCRGIRNLETPVKSANNEASEAHSAKPGVTPDAASSNAEQSVKPKPGNPTLSYSPIIVPGLSKADASKAAKKARQFQKKSDKQRGIKSNEKKKPEVLSTEPEVDPTFGFHFDDILEQDWIQILSDVTSLSWPPLKSQSKNDPKGRILAGPGNPKPSKSKTSRKPK